MLRLHDIPLLILVAIFWIGGIDLVLGGKTFGGILMIWMGISFAIAVIPSLPFQELNHHPRTNRLRYRLGLRPKCSFGYRYPPNRCTRTADLALKIRPSSEPHFTCREHYENQTGNDYAEETILDGGHDP